MRHGQTPWNRDGRFRGRSELGLDERGFKQAQAVAKHIASYPVSAIYSSPLRRAIETAEAIAQALGLTVEPVDGLTDIDFGQWQGLSPDELSEEHRELYRRWLASPHLVRPPQGESLEEVSSRALKAVKQIAERHENETVVTVSHEGVGRVILCTLLGADLSQFRRIQQDLASISIFEMRDGGAVVTRINELCHLKGIDG
ncbi:MAG: histidine phosphatase family protein [Dehalococcoidia bacterium]